MVRRALSLVFLMAVLSLAFASLGAAEAPCSGAAAPPASAAAFLAGLASLPSVEPAASMPHGAQPATSFCTKDVCSAARAECRASCPLTCVMNFQCNYPTCNSCQCTC